MKPGFHFPNVLRGLIYAYLTNSVEIKHLEYYFESCHNPKLSKDQLNRAFFGDMTGIKSYESLNSDLVYNLLVRIYNQLSKVWDSPEVVIKYRSPYFEHDGHHIIYHSIKVNATLRDHQIYLRDQPCLILGSNNWQFSKGNTVCNSVPGQVIMYLLKDTGHLYYTFLYGSDRTCATAPIIIPTLKCIIWLDSNFILSLDGNLTEVIYQQTKKSHGLPIIYKVRRNVLLDLDDPPIRFTVDRPNQTFRVQYLSGINHVVSMISN